MEEMNSLKFYKSYFEAINDLEDEDRLQLYDAIMRYQFLNEEPEFDNKYLTAIWKTIVPNINSYNNSVVQGQKGGRPKKETGVKKIKNPPFENAKTEEEEEEEVEVEVDADADADNNTHAPAPAATDEVYVYYQNNIDVLTQRAAEVIEPYRKTMDDNLIIYAMKLAVEAKARRLNYVEGVLRSWAKKGITTLLQAQEEQATYRSRGQPVEQDDSWEIARRKLESEGVI